MGSIPVVGSKKYARKIIKNRKSDENGNTRVEMAKCGLKIPLTFFEWAGGITAVAFTGNLAFGVVNYAIYPTNIVKEYLLKGEKLPPVPVPLTADAIINGEILLKKAELNQDDFSGLVEFAMGVKTFAQAVMKKHSPTVETVSAMINSFKLFLLIIFNRKFMEKQKSKFN